LGHLVNYELLYAEMLLSSSLANDNRRSSLQQITKREDILREIIKDSDKDDISWLLERFLVAALPCFDVYWVLMELLGKNNSQTVINVLLMSDFRNIRKHRSYDVKAQFMESGGKDYILSNLPRKEVIHLLIAATSGFRALKTFDLSEV
jgi:hypothetical protein